eukprot:COSAG05_NODE_150_length_16171_cov_64.740356_13_plen_365_part_00
MPLPCTIGVSRHLTSVCFAREGPCWDECIANSSRTPPIACSASCDEEQYQLDTMRRVKALNPGVSNVFYLNTLYDFPYYNLTGQFTAADLHLRDISGRVAGLENDNGMLHIPIFDFSKPAAVQLFLDFHRRLIASGNVDGSFPDKANERAFQNKSNNQWCLCENPGGPPSSHSWAAACVEITKDTALAYNAGKEQMLRELVQLYGMQGALWPVCSAGVEQCGSVCSRQSPCTLGLGGKTHVEKHAEIVATLRNFSYVYFMMGDTHNEGMTCCCSPADVIHFLLILEEGCILGCNGRESSPKHAVPPLSWWSNHIGRPLAPPRLSVDGRVVSRSFESGVRVLYDTVNTPLALCLRRSSCVGSCLR